MCVCGIHNCSEHKDRSLKCWQWLQYDCEICRAKYSQNTGTSASIGITASYFVYNITLSLKNLSNTWREYLVKLLCSSIPRGL